MAALTAYRWPGNVRELRNVVERAVILSQDDHVGVEHVADVVGRAAAAGRADAVAVGDRVTLDRVEEAHIRRVLAASPSLQSAADVLGIDLATLWRRRKKYGI